MKNAHAFRPPVPGAIPFPVLCDAALLPGLVRSLSQPQTARSREAALCESRLSEAALSLFELAAFAPELEPEGVSQSELMGLWDRALGVSAQVRQTRAFRRLLGDCERTDGATRRLTEEAAMLVMALRAHAGAGYGGDQDAGLMLEAHALRIEEAASSYAFARERSV